MVVYIILLLPRFVLVYRLLTLTNTIVFGPARPVSNRLRPPSSALVLLLTICRVEHLPSSRHNSSTAPDRALVAVVVVAFVAPCCIRCTAFVAPVLAFVAPLAFVATVIAFVADPCICCNPNPVTISRTSRDFIRAFVATDFAFVASSRVLLLFPLYLLHYGFL
jgi:hypothetical protein